jgi:hypothetical protein
MYLCVNSAILSANPGEESGLQAARGAGVRGRFVDLFSLLCSDANSYVITEPEKGCKILLHLVNISQSPLPLRRFAQPVFLASSLQPDGLATRFT